MDELQTAWETRDKLYSEGAKFYAESRKLYSEGAKFYAEDAKLRAEGDKLYAEGYEGELIWVSTVIEVTAM